MISWEGKIVKNKKKNSNPQISSSSVVILAISCGDNHGRLNKSEPTDFKQVKKEQQEKTALWTVLWIQSGVFWQKKKKKKKKQFKKLEKCKI